MEIKRVICIQCHNACRLIAKIDGNRLISVEPDLEFINTKKLAPISKGCPRRRAVVEYFYHPYRLNYPLKRAGSRGENRWQRISWEDALSEIAEKMKTLINKYGPETIATTSGTGRTHDEIRLRFFNILGSPNHIGPSEICYGPMCAMGYTIFGWRLFPVVRPNTRCVILWGGGGPRYWDQFWKAAIKARKDYGTKIIVIDPRKTDSVKHSDLWLQIRPGTDCALALGMINYIIEEGLYDKEFVEKWCYGFDKLKSRVKEYPLEKVSEITWIPQEKIRQAAIWYATLRPGVINHGMGIEHLANSIEALHAHYILPAITGNVDVKGGDIFPAPYPGIIHDQEIAARERLSIEQINKTLGIERFRFLSRIGFDKIQSNVSRLWGNEANNRSPFECYAHAPTVYRAILTGKPYPVRCLITLASNPMVTQANTRLVYEALKSLDLYVVVDFFMTPSGQLADYVLPSTTYLERPWLWTYSGIMGSERAMPKSIDNLYDRRDDYDIWRGLAQRLGQEESDWPWESLEDVYDYRLKPIGLSFKEFMEKGGYLPAPKEYQIYEKQGFATPTGKIELYSTILESLGYDPLPQYYESPESPISRPDLAKEFPLILITGGRFQPFYHSEHRQVKTLRRMHPDPFVQIHPETAKTLNIENGDWVWIESPRGRIKQKCKIFDGIHPNVIHAQHGWWYPEEDGREPSLHGVWKSNCNVLTDDDPEICNRISGGWPLRGFLCKVYKADSFED